jgi:hypothetical protein
VSRDVLTTATQGGGVVHKEACTENVLTIPAMAATGAGGEARIMGSAMTQPPGRKNYRPDCYPCHFNHSGEGNMSRQRTGTARRMPLPLP